MASRTELQTLLETVLGSSFVYFQPPPTFYMQYPCIVYSRSDVDAKHADNNPYSNTKRYQVTIIDRDPDSLIPDKVGALQSAEFQRFYEEDGLNHDVYLLYF